MAYHPLCCFYVGPRSGNTLGMSHASGNYWWQGGIIPGNPPGQCARATRLKCIFLLAAIICSSIRSPAVSSLSTLLMAVISIDQVHGELFDRSQSFIRSLKHELGSPLFFILISSICFPSSLSARHSANPTSSQFSATIGRTNRWSSLSFGLFSRPAWIINGDKLITLRY